MIIWWWKIIFYTINIWLNPDECEICSWYIGCLLWVQHLHCVENCVLSHAWLWKPVDLGRGIQSCWYHGPWFAYWIQHPNLHNCSSRAHVFMAFMATLNLLLMPKVNGVYRLYVSFNNPLLYWLHNAVCSKYSLDKIAKREIIKRLFCHVIHGDMTSQLDITWQRGETIAKYLFISIWKLANSMAQNHISGVNLSALYT